MAELLRKDVGWVRPRRSARFLAVGLVLVLLVPFGPLLVAPAHAADSDVCFAVTNLTSGNSELWSMPRTTADASTNTGTHIADLTIGGVKGLVYDPFDAKLYAAHGDTLSELDPATGARTAVGTFGTGDGTPGNNLPFSDVNGLAVDPFTGTMYAIHRRNNAHAVLFLVDPSNAPGPLRVEDAFGTGIDYVTIEDDLSPTFGALPTPFQLKDIAVDPANGELLVVTGLGTSSGDDTDHVLTIDPANGEVDGLRTLVESPDVDGLTDVGGLDFHNDGTFYGQTGSTSGVPRTLFQLVESATNLAGEPVGQYPSPDTEDHESLACLTGTSASISGVVYRDDDHDGVHDATEPLHDQPVTMWLYRSLDGDATRDEDDPLVATVESDPTDGSYRFEIATTGGFFVVPDPADLPTDASGWHPPELAVSPGTSGADIAYRATTGTVSGVVWYDTDGDGVQDVDEPSAPPAAVTVTLYADTDVDGRPDGTALDSTTVDTTDGTWVFDGIAPGDYVVVVPETVADAYVLTTANSPYAVHGLTAGDVVSGVDFGYDDYDPTVTITAGSTASVEAASSVVYPHTITNRGNVPDTYDVTAVSSQGWEVELWEDVDGDGALDPSVDRLLSSPADTGTVAPDGGSFDLLAVVDVPSGAARGTVDTLTVSVTGQAEPQATADATDTTTVIAPRIEVVKTSSTATGNAIPGERIDYRVEVRNVDDGVTATAASVDVDDGLADPSHGTIDGATIAVDGDHSVPDSFPVALGDLAPGALHVITFQVVVSRPLADGTVIVNTATATADNAEGDLLTDQDTAADTVASSAIPQLVKTAIPTSGTTVDPGDTITYRLSVTNRSDATDTWRNVTVTDAEPDSTTDYVVGSARLNGAPLADGGTNPFASGFALGDLPPGATVTLTFDVEVHDPIADGTVIVNVAEATGTNTGPLYASVSHVVEVGPAVSLTPDRSGTVEPPGTITYAHVLRNDGDVTDTYDLSATSDHGWSVELRHDVDGDGQIDAGEPIVADRVLAPGEVSRLLATVSVPAGVTSGTVDTVTLVATSRIDPAISATAFDVTTAVTGELEVRKSADPSSSVVNPGMDVTYSIEVENVGGAPARDVVLTDDTPSGATYRQGSTTWDGVPVPDGATGDRNPLASLDGGLDLGDIAPGALATVRFTVRIDDPLPDDTLILNVAEAEGSPGLTGFGSVTQIVRSSPVFDVDKAADVTGSVEPRERVTYTLTVANVGNEAATGVVLTDATPSGTNYVPGSTTVNGSPVADDGTNPLDPSNDGLRLPDLPVGGPPVAVAFEVTVADPVADGTVITNEATVASAEGVSAPSPRIQHTVNVQPGVTVEPDHSTDVVIPGVAVYAHDVTNTGNVTDTFALAATSSEGWTTTLYADDDGDGVWDSATETTAVTSTGPVPPGGRFPLIAIVDVPATAVPGTVDTTTVRAGSSADPAVDAAATDLTRAVAPALRVTKTATPSGDQVNAGQIITYAVTVRNVGGATASDVNVVDDAPENTTYVAGSATAGTTPVPDAAGADPNPFSSAAGGYSVVELEAGATITLGFEVRVSTTVAVGTDIVNTATATAAHTADPIAATRTHTVTSGPVLDLRKTAEPVAPGPVTARKRITYEVTLRNIGQEPATGVRLIDDTPIDTTYVDGSTTVDGAPIADGSLDPNPLSSQYAGYGVGDLQADGTPVTVRFTVEVVDPVPDGGTITNAASATSTEGATATTPPVEHDIDVHPAVRVGPDGTLPVLAGGTAVHPLTVTNEGDVTDVYTFNADTSRGWTLVLRADPDGDGSVDAGEPEITATGSLAPGEAYPVTLAVTAPSGTSPGTTDTTVVDAVSTGDGAVRDAATLTTHVVAGRLSLQKTASPLSVSPGARTTYTLTVTNEGDAPATDVVLTDRTPAGTTYARGSTQRDGRTVADRSGGDGNPLAAGLAIGTLNPGASTTVSFRVDVLDEPDREVIVNAAEVTAADALPDRAGTTQPISRTHALDLSPSDEEVIRSGTAVHAHTVTNTGDVADEVVVSATSDQGYTVTVYRDTDADGTLDDDDPALAAPIDLAPGASAALLVAVSVPQGTPGGTRDVTTVTATSLGDPAVSVAVEDVTRVMAPALVITKEVAPGVAVAPDSELTFTIVVTNDGNASATDLVVTDPTPAGTTYVPGSVTVDGAPVADAAGDAGDLDTNPLDDRNGGVAIERLEPGEQVTVRFRAVVIPEVVSGTDLTNVAFVASTETGMLSSPPVSVQVHGSTSLVIAKGVDTPGVVGIGTPVTWAVQVTNVTPETADDVVIIDRLPPGVAYQPGTTTLDGLPVPDDAGPVTGSGLQIGPIAPGATRLVTFRTVTTGEAGLVENVAVATHGGSGATVLSNPVLIRVAGVAGIGADAGILPQTGAPVTRTLGAGLVLALTGWSLLFVARRQDPPSPVSRPRPPWRHDQRSRHQ